MIIGTFGTWIYLTSYSPLCCHMTTMAKMSQKYVIICNYFRLFTGNSWFPKDSDIVQCGGKHLRLYPLSPFVHPSHPTLLSHGCSSHHHNWAGSLSCVDRPRLALTMISPACLTLDTMGPDKQWRCWPISELTDIAWSEETGLFHPEQLDNNWEIHIPLMCVRVRCVTL